MNLPIILLFFLSGVAGLGYQVLWVKYLQNFIGVSSYAYMTVLVVFMGGLALGGQLLARTIDRQPCCLRFYALMEMAIGLYALLLFEPLLNWLGNLYLQSATDLTHVPLLRAGMAIVLLLPPAMAMGTTFPAVLRYLSSQTNNAPYSAAMLYASNALGAACGSLGSAYLLIPTHGLSACLILLASLNLLLALYALIVSKIWPQGDLERIPPRPGRIPFQYAIVIFAAGILSFSLEIGYTRTLVLVFGSSTYTFALIVSSFILGITFGSIVVGTLQRRIAPNLTIFGWLLIALSLLLLLKSLFYPYLPSLIKIMVSLLSAKEEAFLLSEALRALFCFVLLIPPGLLIGGTIPLFIHLVEAKAAESGYISAQVYAINTWGNVLGAILGTLVILPMLGQHGLFLMVGTAFGLLGLYCLNENAKRLLAGTSLISCVALHFLYPWDMRYFSVVPTRRQDNLTLKRVFEDDYLKGELLFCEDDAVANVMVYRRESQGKPATSLLVNGKADASDRNDMPTQILLGQTPMLLHPDAKDVLVIGYGSGVTAGTVLKHPITSMEIVELSKAVIKTSPFFEHVNHQPLKDPRVHLIVEDAYAHLGTSPRQYDVIISEPSNPWIAGVGSLFCTDFYQRTKARLRADGIFLQWLQAYELSDQTFFNILATFRSVYPHVRVFLGGSNDLMLVGTNKPLSVSYQSMRAAWLRPGIQEELVIAQRNSLFEVLFAEIFSPEAVALLSARARTLNSRDNLWLEYQAPIDLFSRSYPSAIIQEDIRLYSPQLSLGAALASARPSPDLMADSILTGRQLQGQFKNHLLDALLSLGTHFSFESIPSMALVTHWPNLQPPMSPQYFQDLLASLMNQNEPDIAMAMISMRFPSIVLQGSMSEPARQKWLEILASGRDNAKRLPLLSLLRASLFLINKEDISALTELNQMETPVPSQWFSMYLLLRKNLSNQEFIRALNQHEAHYPETVMAITHEFSTLISQDVFNAPSTGVPHPRPHK